MSKSCQFWVLMLITAVATTILLSPQALQHRWLPTASLLTSGIQRPQLQEVAAVAPAQAWRNTGATVLPLAAQIMAMRNSPGIPLNVGQKGYLRPLFGDLVDRVTIVYQAKLLDRWSQDGQETHIGSVNSAAQTYCDRIYIRAAHQPRQTDGLILLAHEMTHSQQCQQAGGIGQFGERYFQGYFQGGQKYENNPLEQSARNVERKFARQLCDLTSCPPQRGRYYVNYRGWGMDLPVNL